MKGNAQPKSSVIEKCSCQELPGPSSLIMASASPQQHNGQAKNSGNQRHRDQQSADAESF